MMGRRLCVVHGGKNPRGLAAPGYVHGRYSKDLPTRLAARYQASQSDPDLLNLSAELSLLDARLHDVLGRVDTGESGQVWRDLRTTYKEMQAAHARRDLGALSEALSTIGALIQTGASDYAAWADVRSLIDQRRKLVQTETRRRTDMQQMVTAEQAMVLVSRITGIIREHVHERGALAAIVADLSRLVSHDDPG